MNSYKRLLTTLVIVAVIVAGGAGLAVILGFATAESTIATLTTVYQVFGLVALVSAIIIAVLRMNKSE
ncbi:hypothetical protein KC723_00790 [Candidatus Kaiserbacteria bacterium]|nr:hypothetical protein [Candidatus Kaiserbacteria bacterium]